MRIFVILALLCLPTMGLAQRVTVRSGEHADFSRLAFEFSSPIKWEMGRVEQGYEIRLHEARPKIDISEVYRRIPRDRIKDLSVSEDATRILLDLGCDCHADAFEFRPGLLVVDVKDGQASPTSRFEGTFSSGELITDQQVNAEKSGNSGHAIVEGTRDEASIELPLSIPNTQASNGPNLGLFSEKSEDTARQVSEMQSEILHQIGRAASQGLLNADVPQPARVEPNTPPPPEAIAKPPPALIITPHLNIHVESSIDREFSDLTKQHFVPSSGKECLSKTLFNITEWGDEDAILAKISEKRSALMGEFDNADAQDIKGLVRAYLYAGFGAEALGVLSSFDVMVKEDNTLRAMAHIVDGTTPDQYYEFADQLGCDSASALWAALAVPSLSKQGQINSTAILGTFSGLPIHLRRLLGPHLAQKFLEIDDVETAHALRNAIARSSGESNSEFHLLDAKLDLERGLNDSAEHTLEDIVTNDKGEAPNALIELIELRLQNKETISQRTLATAETYIFEQRGTKTAANLKRLVALSLAQSGDFMSALDALNELKAFENLDTKAEAAAWSKVVGHLALEASEATLLQFVFAAQDDLTHQNISRKMRRQLARRLVKSGWPIKAEMILSAPTSPTADDRMILAQSGILNGQTEPALRMLENVAGNEAANLRASAYARIGNHLAAAQEYRAIKDAENQKISAWRAKDWAQLIRIGSEVDQAAAKVMLPEGRGNAEAEPSLNGTIAYDASLLAKSKEERQLIETLLENHPAIAQEES